MREDAMPISHRLVMHLYGNHNALYISHLHRLLLTSRHVETDYYNNADVVRCITTACHT